MESVIRPHRGGTVLAVGILGLLSPFVLVPLGALAWFLGGRDLRGMKAGQIDPSGRVATQVGHVFGIAGTILWLGIAGIFTLAVATHPGPMTSHSWDGDHPGVRQTQVSYESKKGDDGIYRDVVELDFREVQRADGQWVKDGPFIRWSRGHVKLEEGNYNDGKREGAWSF